MAVGDQNPSDFKPKNTPSDIAFVSNTWMYVTLSTNGSGEDIFNRIRQRWRVIRQTNSILWSTIKKKKGQNRYIRKYDGKYLYLWLRNEMDFWRRRNRIQQLLYIRNEAMRKNMEVESKIIVPSMENVSFGLIISNEWEITVGPKKVRIEHRPKQENAEGRQVVGRMMLKKLWQPEDFKKVSGVTKNCGGTNYNFHFSGK